MKDYIQIFQNNIFRLRNGRFYMKMAVLKNLFKMYFEISILLIGSFERFELIQNLFFGFILTTWHLGAGTSTDIKEGMQCKIVCNAAYPTPEQIKCLNTGWDHESVSTTVTKSSQTCKNCRNHLLSLTVGSSNLSSTFIKLWPMSLKLELGQIWPISEIVSKLLGRKAI